MHRATSWIFVGLLAVLVVGLIALFAVRAYMPGFLARQILVTHSPSKAVPSDYGVPYKSVRFASGDHILSAWQVSASADAPALLIYHGNSETIHDWAQVQAFLARHGLSSMVFDYSGYGTSGGKPMIEGLNRDGIAAYSAFRKWAGPKRPKFVLGFSLGTGVLLYDLPLLKPQPDGAVVYGAFNSAHDLVMYLGMPHYFNYLIPRFWESAANAHLAQHDLLLVEAGADDANVPPVMGRQVAQEGGAPFKLVWGADHEDIHRGKLAVVWAPILSALQARMDAKHWQGPKLTLEPEALTPAQ